MSGDPRPSLEKLEIRASTVTVTRALAVVLGLVVTGLSIFLVIARFRFPIEAEWMVGTVLDTIERVRDGKQIYVAPSLAFIPFIYTPIYYWLAGALAHVMPVEIAARVVSLAASVVSGWGIFRITRVLGAERFWSWMAVLLHVACYPVTLFFYDIARVDATSAAFVVLGLTILLASEADLATAAGGVVLGAAFFVKQPGILAFAAAVIALLLGGQRRRAGIVAGTGAIVIAALFAFLMIRSDGWFYYYCIKLPRGQGIEPALVSTFFIVDLPHVFTLAIATAALSVPLAASLIRTRRAPARWDWRETLFVSVLAASAAGAFFLRAHRGGWSNVIVLWTPLGCAAVGVGATRLERLAKDTPVARLVAALAAGAMIVQMLAAMFDPHESAPEREDYEASERFAARVNELERHGEVFVSPTGHMTTPRHFQAGALWDVLRTGDPAPPDYLAALRDHRFIAIYVGDPNEAHCEHAPCREAWRSLALNYFVAAQRPLRDHLGTTGYDGRPRWLMRPRQEPLDPSKDDLELTQLEQIEMGLAEAHLRTCAPDTEPAPDDTIEARARTVAAATPRWPKASSR